MMTKDIMDYIVNESKLVAVKLAAINALSFDMDRIGTGRDNFSLLLKYLKQKYGVVSNEDLYNKLDATTLISLAYTRAMSDYFNVDEALNLALMAQLKAPNSLSIAVVLGLIESQIAMDGDNWCNVFVAFYARIYLNGLNSDFDLKGISVISEYIDLYREYCN